MLVGTHGGNAGIGGAPSEAAVSGLREVHVRHEPLTGGVVPRVVEGQIDITRHRIHGQPLIESVH